MLRLLTGLLCSLLTLCAHAALQTADDFERWMNGYYQHPQPTELAPALRFAVEHHLLDKPDVVGPPVFGFVAGAVRNQPKLAADLLRDLDSLDEQSLALMVIGGFTG